MLAGGVVGVLTGRKPCFLLAGALSLCVWVSAAAEQPVVTDGEVWNEGVGYYDAGDVTNALRVLRPLMLSKTHGARAAEVVAKLEHERGNREEAAFAAQIALRANPSDAQANRNFTRATDGLAEFREAARIDKILKAAQGKDPGSMIQGATYDVRRLMGESAGYRTNEAVRAVALADQLAKRAATLADTWIPVRELIAQSVTNEEQAATILAQVEQAQAKTKKAARELADLDEGAYSTLGEAEHDFTRFLKLTVMPPAAIGEDLVAQSNAWQDVERFNGRDWQQDALDFTRAFRQKFPMWAKQYEQQAQADTNKPPFTAEDQAKISGLATELEKIQIECTEKSLPAQQEKAIELINQIRELLPKDKNGGQNQQNQQNQQNRQNQQQQDQQQNQDQQEKDQQDQPSDQKQEENPEQKPEEQKDEQKDEPQQSEEDKEVEAVLKKAQERNDEHEAEKKARMRKAPLPPNERDW